MPDVHPLWRSSQDVSAFLVSMGRESGNEVPFGMQRVRKRDAAREFKKMNRKQKEEKIRNHPGGSEAGSKEAVDLMLTYMGSQDRQAEAFRGSP